MSHISAQSGLRFTGPVTPDAPELRQLLDAIAVDSAKRDQERGHPYDALELIRQARLGALRLPLGEGGGASLQQLYAVARALATADSNVAHVLRNHYVFVERYVLGQTHPQTTNLRKAVADGAIIGLALTELERSTVGGGGPFHTKLVADGGHFRLSGVKYYSTGTLYADFVVVRGDGPDGTQGTAIIPTDRPGLERIDDWDGIGQRVTGSGTTRFDNVLVHADEVIWDDGQSYFLLPYTSTIAQLFVTTVNVGILFAILRDAKKLIESRTRTWYFAPSPDPRQDPILLQTIGEISAAAFVSESAIQHSAALLDRVVTARQRGEDFTELSHEASIAAAKTKVVVDELVLRAGSQLFDVGGASAATQGPNFDRHWRNARTLASHNPASYKALAIGGWELNGTRLPTLGFF